MQLPSLTVALLSLVGATQAWELTGYALSEACNDMKGPYRVLTGASNLNSCFTFTKDMPGTQCTHYTKGGATRSNCDKNSFTYPTSVKVRGTCAIYNLPNCDASNGISVILSGNGECGSFPSKNYVGGWMPINSFQCWD
ncbi:hypothetical protein QBC43DRAFT_358054 [Cladorrhinum sp. PSN259]|nr:hypothetical protein QBC43DRAFT_358054 [Cladorrhinum sp. PSN259]